jgi:hypothetical protein
MRTLKTEELALVAGAGDLCPEPTKQKGNNGWGNGPDSTNPGSFSGATEGSKEDNTWTPGDGPRPDKFTTR